MHTVGSTYTRILQTDYKVGTALQIGGTDTVGNISDAAMQTKTDFFREDKLFSIKTSASAFSSGAPSVGGCIAKSITVRLLEPNADIPRRARLVPYANIYNATEASGWIPKGVFYIDTRKKLYPDSGNPVLELTGYDAMMLTEQMYTGGTKTLDIEVVQEIASRIGVRVDSRTVSLMTKGFQIPKSDEYTYREVLGFIAALYGGNFVMSDYGHLWLIPLKGG